MREFLIGVRKYAPLQFDYGRTSAFELLYKERSSDFRFDDIAAGKDVHGGI